MLMDDWNANLLPDITDLLRKGGSKLIAFAVREHFTGNLTWGVCQSLNSSKKSASVVSITVYKV